MIIKHELIRKIALVLIIAGFFGGCAAKKEDVKLVWPLPPERARIEYAGKIDRSSDVERKSWARKLLDLIVGGSSDTGFGKPYGIFVDSEKTIYVADSTWRKVLVFNREQEKFLMLGVDGNGRLDKARNIAVDSAGDIYVTDIVQRRVVVYNKKGEFTRAIGSSKIFDKPVGIAISNKYKRLFVSDTGKNNVSAFSLDGKFLFSFGERGEEDGKFNFPTSLAVDNEGKVYVVDTFNFRIQIFDQDGNFQFKFGSVGTGFGQFAKPKGIAVNSKGHIYVTDAAFNNVQIFDQDGRLLLFFGGFGVKDGMFWLPAGIAIDDKDRVYVADQYNRRINIYNFLGSDDVE